MTTAELFIRCLENERVDYIFGVPGEENEDVILALKDSSITFVTCRHEQGAAFMANVYGRVTGKAGVCLATLGPGATNLITGLADAHLDKVPVVAITGQGGLDRIHHESHQMIDVVKMLEPICKYNTSIVDSATTSEIVRKAFKLAQHEKPGVCHIELSESVASQKTQKTNALKVYRSRIPFPETKAMEQAIKIINNGKRVLILAGNGAIRNRANSALHQLVTQHNIPVASTFMGKGAISDHLPQSLISAGLNFKDYVIEAFERADVVICIGYDIAEFNPKNWNRGEQKEIIHIDFDPAEVYEEYIPTVEIVGDIETIIKTLTTNVKSENFDTWYQDIRLRIIESINHFGRPSQAHIFNVPSVVNAVSNLLDKDTIVISDVGAHKMWIARNLLTKSPQGCIISNGMASMGIALPGAIGAALAKPEKNIVAMMGDGGFLMNVQELETAKRMGIAACLIVFVNDDYELISWKQNMSTGESYGTTFDNPDFVKLGEAFDINTVVPRSHDDLRSIIQNSWENKLLTLIAIPVQSQVNEELINKLDKYYN